MSGQLRLWRTGLLAVTMALVAQSGATQGLESYVQPYNTLVGMLNDRLLAAGVTSTIPFKDAGSTNFSERSVSQTDLNLLRGQVVMLLANNYGVVDTTNLYVDVWNVFPIPFPFLHAHPSEPLFTKVPGAFTANGLTIANNDFTNVPPLWVHFQEIYDRMLTMTNTISSGIWTNNGENNYTNSYGETGQNQNGWTPVYCECNSGYWEG